MTVGGRRVKVVDIHSHCAIPGAMEMAGQTTPLNLVIGTDRLRQMDKIAYIRFASVYRSFGDVETMFEEIQNLLNRDKNE